MWRINGRLQGPDERSLGEVPIMVKVNCKPLCWKFEYFRQNRSCKFSCQKLERSRSHRSFRVFCCVPFCDFLSNRFIFRAQCISDGTKPLPEPILTNPIIINGIHLKAASQGIFDTSILDINGLVQETRYSCVLALELRLSCTNPLIWVRKLLIQNQSHIPQMSMSYGP